jgi:hypothetical protein
MSFSCCKIELGKPTCSLVCVTNCAISALNIINNNNNNMGPGYLSRYDSLRAELSGDRIPVGRYFPHSSIPALRPTQRPRRGVNHPLPCSAEVKERVELYLYFPSGTSWPVLWQTLSLTTIITIIVIIIMIIIIEASDYNLSCLNEIL